VLADRTATMHLGCLCEEGSTAAVFKSPAHPYTAALLSAIPPRGRDVATGQRIRLLGEPPSPLRPPAGCRFHTRCGYARDACSQSAPDMAPVRPGQNVACFFPLPSPEKAPSSETVAR
jgi:oligopeptide/dipeptide ABC transporter ATP-binding protein